MVSFPAGGSPVSILQCPPRVTVAAAGEQQPPGHRYEARSRAYSSNNGGLSGSWFYRILEIIPEAPNWIPLLWTVQYFYKHLLPWMTSLSTSTALEHLPFPAMYPRP